MEAADATTRAVALPGCKSLSARALLLAASAAGESRIRGLSEAEDTRQLVAALGALGVGLRAEGDVLTVRGLAGPPRARGLTLDVGAAAASFRFLCCWLAAGDVDVVLTGVPRLFERPHQALFAFLESRGARCTPLPQALRLESRGLRGGEWAPPLAESSQFMSGLLLAAPLCGPVFLRLEGPIPSAGYVDLTLEALRGFAGPLAAVARPGGLQVAGGIPPAAAFEVPGDPSAASFFLVALCLLGGRARLRPPWSPVHPEARLHRALFDAGLLSGDQQGLAASGRAPAEPLAFDLDLAPDAGPALAVLGAFLPAGVVLRRIGRLRFKESDRVAGSERLLAALGARWRRAGDALEIFGGADAGARAAFDPQADHRLAMAAGVAQLRCPGLQVLDRQCVAKSFPRFWEELAPWRPI